MKVHSINVVCIQWLRSHYYTNITNTNHSIEIQIHTNFGKARGFSNARQFVFTNCRSTTNTTDITNATNITKECQNSNKYQYQKFWILKFDIWNFFKLEQFSEENYSALENLSVLPKCCNIWILKFSRIEHPSELIPKP